MNTQADPKTVVADFLKIFSSGDVDAILACLTDDAHWWVSGKIEGMSGSNDKSTLGEILRQVKPLYVEKALRVAPSAMIAEGNRVAVEAESFATLTSGRVYNNRYHFLFDVEGDKIAGVKEYSDTMHMWETFAG